jgi:hypothetical protein
MKQESQTTRIREYINKILPDAHGHQQKAIALFVQAIVFIQSCRQSSLARYFDNFEAFSKRLSRLIHNERIDEREVARSHTRWFVLTLPGGPPLGLSLDWTSEGDQHLLVASIQIGRRAVPLYWRGYETKDLKSRMSGYEHSFLKELFEEVLPSELRRRFIFTADRGFADVDLMDLLDLLGVSYIIRVKGSHKVLVDGKWVRIDSLKWQKNQRRRTWGAVWYCESNPKRVQFTQSRAKGKNGKWGVWSLVSNRPISAKRMSYEYGCRFGCEEGFRDEKSLLGFREARIICIKAWQKMFLLAAIALLMLAQLGCSLLKHKKMEEWLRKIRSRRKKRSELSLVYCVVELLKKETELWTLLDNPIKLNLNARL